MAEKYRVVAGIIRGTNPPPYVLKAYGRQIFRLLHTGDIPGRSTLYMRDLPMGIHQLAFDYWHRPEAWNAYQAECDRVGIPQFERI